MTSCEWYHGRCFEHPPCYPFTRRPFLANWDGHAGGETITSDKVKRIKDSTQTRCIAPLEDKKEVSTAALSPGGQGK